MRSCVWKCGVAYQHKLTYTVDWIELPNGKLIEIFIADDASRYIAGKLTSFDPLYLAPSVMNGRYEVVLEAGRSMIATLCDL